MGDITTFGVPGIRVDSVVQDKRPGAFGYQKRDDEIGGILFRCPCGCGAFGSVKFDSDGWQWNGDLENPTVSPSIHNVTPNGCGWHGYLRQGRWVKA